MSVPSLPQSANPVRFLAWPVVFGLLLPLLLYAVLPMLGVHAGADALSLRRLALLFILGVGGLAYGVYLRFVLPRPQLIVLFMAVAWVLVECLNQFLLEVAGINLHMRPLLLMAIAVPALWMGGRHFGLLWNAVPHFKYYGLFFLWLAAYFLFYNANAQDPRLAAGESVWSEGSVGIIQAMAYFYCLLAIAVSGVAMLKVRDARGFFDGLNQALLVMTGLHAALTILGYPLGLFSMPLDGFTRATGLFTHPNPYAHHMGLLLIYTLGLFCYYQGAERQRMPAWLLTGSLALTTGAFLLGLSKTAIAGVSFCAGVLFLVNLTIPAVQRRLSLILLALLVVIPMGLWVFQAVSGQSFFSILEARMDQAHSFVWRTQVWEDLLAGIHPGSLWLGHGFTSANAAVFQYTYNDLNNAKPLMMVHNGYIALLYDLGVMGYLMFAAVLVLAGRALTHVLMRVRPDHKTLWSMILALSIYFLFVCAFDEMTYMFNAPMLFWLLATVMWCLMLRESRS